VRGRERVVVVVGGGGGGVCGGVNLQAWTAVMLKYILFIGMKYAV
jgi:hypothetical protein